MIFLSIKIGYFISEKYFFDKFFYQKSVKFGYLPSSGEKIDWTKYGDRDSTISSLFIDPETPKVLGSTSNEYVIALIGDSHVWGMGIEENKTLSKILEKRLNIIRKTKVLQLGFPGDSLIDNYVKYVRLDEQQKVDLYVFVVVENDLIFNSWATYDSDLTDNIYHMCDDISGEFTYNVEHKRLNDLEYAELRDQSYINPKNICLLNKLVPLYPKNNAIYFETALSFKKKPVFDVFSKTIRENNMTVISSDLGKNYIEYKKYFDENDFDIFRVSKKDGHPSSFANQMYSDILFDEITQNPQWSFNSD